jgi:hypothetical protein
MVFYFDSHGGAKFKSMGVGMRMVKEKGMKTEIMLSPSKRRVNKMK